MKDFRIYRPNKTQDGVAAAIQLSYKTKLQYDKWQLFLVIAPQTGLDEKNNAQFAWNDPAKAITVRLGDNDVAEMLAVLVGRKKVAGGKNLFHQTPGGGNKAIVFSRKDNGDGYYIRVSAQDADRKNIGPLSIVFSEGEGVVLSILLRSAVNKMYGW